MWLSLFLVISSCLTCFVVGFIGNVGQVCNFTGSYERCKQKFDGVMITGNSPTSCTAASVAGSLANITRESSSCFPLFVKFDDLGTLSGNKDDFSITDELVGVEKCPLDKIEIRLATKCEVALSQEDKDFQNLCSNFSLPSDQCKCDMFSIVTNNNTKFNLCDIFYSTNPKQKSIQYSTVPLSNENTNYRSILQRSCLFLNKVENCDCQDFTILKGNSTERFCFVTNLEGLCNFFKKPMNECTCAIFNFQNNSGNSQSVCEYFEWAKGTDVNLVYMKKYLVPFAAVETVASTIGIFGNLLVVTIAIRFSRGLSTCKRLIAHLALNDLYFAVFQLVYAVPKFWESKFIYGNAMCKVLKSVDYLGTFLAIGIILTISVERFIGIINPFSRGISNKGIQGILLFNFVVGVSATMPYFYYLDIDAMGVCRAHWPNSNRDEFVYHMFVVCFYLVLPIIVITTLYSTIVSTLHGTIRVGKDNFFADPRVRKKRLKDNRRTMYVLIGVVVAFVVLVFPKYLVTVYMNRRGWQRVTDKDLPIGDFFVFSFIIYFAYPFHVAVNPLIYSLVDARWRKDVRHFFKRKSWRSSRSATSGTINTTLSTQRRRSSSATILDDANNNLAKRKSPPSNLKIAPTKKNGSNLAIQSNYDSKISTTPLPTTPTSSNGIWMGERPSRGSVFNFMPYSET